MTRQSTARSQASSGEPRAAHGRQLIALQSRCNILSCITTAVQAYTFCSAVSCSTHLIYQLLCLLHSVVMRCLQRRIPIHDNYSKLRKSLCS
jgi:hypothetical protein